MIDFNNGFLTALALFINHEKDLTSFKFKAACDHIYDMECLTTESRIFRYNAINLNYSFHPFSVQETSANWKKTQKMFDEAKRLLNKYEKERNSKFRVEIKEGPIPNKILEYFKEIDERHYGLKVEVLHW